jgi:hypothetical protein
MKPVKQKYLYTGKQRGDCWRACLASILECDIELFPDPNVITSWPDLYTSTLEQLEKMGYQYESIAVSQLKGSHDNIIAIGKSPRSKRKRITHAVVWNNGIVHDPHPDNTGLLDITRFEIITKQS